MVLAVLFGLAVAVGQASWRSPATPLAFWTDPIVLEFALGILVGVLARRGIRAGRWGACLLVVSLLLAWLAPEGAGRALVRGVPSALMVFCALSWGSLPGWLVLLGDASYALYLVHPFPMRAFRVAIAHMTLPVGVAVPLYLAVTLATCVALAAMLHRWVEQPILRRGREAAR